MAALVQTAKDKAGMGINSVEVKGVTNNVFMIPFGPIHKGFGAGTPHGEIKYVKQADQTRTKTGVTGAANGNILTGVEAGSEWTDTATGQKYFNDAGTSDSSTDWTVIGTDAS